MDADAESSRPELPSGTATPVDNAPQPLMAFTWRDVWRGAWAAWGVFMLIVVGLLVAVTIVNPPSGTYASLEMLAFVFYIVGSAIVSAIVTVIMAPIARAIEQRLRYVASPGIHVAAFAALGAIVGVGFVVAVLAWSAQSGVFTGLENPVAAFVAVAIVAFSTSAGWAYGYGRARRARVGDDTQTREV
ncbi:hypothetical protein [Microbacterium sp. cx-59]|uniref:hypothetical protein n=1 Tax=Microbacterium sp. cx-59 TaxID=2891207 RepID=UPI001E5DD0FD|nr:hypothetical protein [Microbacterium sp. cx-59]MCC4907219.1 hypothetical protein [Microbacterium sp. cx-59]